MTVAPFGTEYGGEQLVRLTVSEDGTRAAGDFTGGSAFSHQVEQRLQRRRPRAPAGPHADTCQAARLSSTQSGV